ncbi:assimilatory sulfite reductase (NADPH) flavoprotein subunit [Paraferrimonas sedimenticola]|uniref:Sulfite reductase [NADPH] flavoprotein alpha-component n=1 Tax=Paraferrimonas sedimenticola TaxID=375674 RepID=A0AA37RUS0_9GAMM|nr:assimilatory sulfite reductase (NADPH) flavoprotein subunit [Paraferrimonas sedimenticola]GLP95661.1 sulfite reductase [NADPH] flavoprotein alpha-component [Paraferrimonas sedimenticola]
MSLKELNQLTSPLGQEQITSLAQLVEGLTPTQQAWISGYLAATSAASAQAQPAGATALAAPVAPAASVAPAAQAAASATLTILYGSQTGNAKKLAQQAAAAAQAQGMAVQVTSMGDYNPRSLKQEQALLLLVSTHGEGDPPDDAIAFHRFIMGKRAPKLENLNYSVLALGDSSYQFYCQTGKELDERLAELGGKRVRERQDCDLDFEEPAAQWQQESLEQLASVLDAAPAPSGEVVAFNAPAAPVAEAQAAGYHADSPVEAEVIAVQAIVGRESVKDIYHVELELPEGLTYQEGDSLGIWAPNREDNIQAILSALELSGDETVEIKQESYSLTQALQWHRELTLITPPQLAAWAELANAAELRVRLQDSRYLNAYLEQRQWRDIFAQFPAKVSAQQLVDNLRPLTPRLYSIASSQAAVEQEVHLCVAQLTNGKSSDPRLGLASNYLAERVDESQKVKVFIEPNSHFKLPDDPNAPVLMIGPGTGIAPFRAFMQAREAQGIKGNSWLFFGNPNFEQDFLYQTEWQQYLKQGVLERISLAFSRDQTEKVYVQHRIEQHSAEVWSWLQKGAHIYVCGDAQRMAKDVESALLWVIQTQGGKDEEQALDYLDELRQARRYQKDVY